MTKSSTVRISFINFFRSVLLWVTLFLSSCHAQSSKSKIDTIDLRPKVAPERSHFTAHIVNRQNNGSKAEIDTITGYRKYYFENGNLQMEGKVTKAKSKDYRDGIWNYYNEAGLLMFQHTYNQEGKVTNLEFLYYTNGKPLSSKYEYYEGDYKNKETFKFHKIETLFDFDGKQTAQRHWINEELVSDE